MPLLDSALPLAAAPMAGGPSTLALATAVGEASGFAFLPAGYLPVEAFAADLTAAHATGQAFGVNLFVPQAGAIAPEAYRAYATELRAEAEALGADLAPEPRHDDDDWRAKVDLLVANPVPVVSLTFGLPGRGDIAALRTAGSRVLATVTAPDEARAAEEAGVDGLVVQGPAAGGHSGTFDPHRPIAGVATAADTADVVRAVAAVTRLPLVAAGGVDGPSAIRDLLAAGAEAVAVGTLLLRAAEAGTSATHRAALADPAFTTTVVTHCFTGRPARALRNGFVDRHHDAAPYGYPELHHLTRDLRRTAARRGDPHRLHLWAGTGWRGAQARPAGEIVRELVAGL
ncbi:nitronate monooxygenase [Nocardioides sp. LHD-245]|uniref:NAD(P)H-dependent flavin oxidoreductase n=1 Tax=Nocardioides sp. LHD-245 TaxID=3051387 RepID=UPI0027E0D502|nr:nitronate monooxygenase [Nocardioides sp. LHD-245]